MTVNFGVQKESNFEFVFSTWKTRKQNNGMPIPPKIIDASFGNRYVTEGHKSKRLSKQRS